MSGGGKSKLGCLTSGCGSQAQPAAAAACSPQSAVCPRPVTIRHYTHAHVIMSQCPHVIMSPCLHCQCVPMSQDVMSELSAGCRVYLQSAVKLCQLSQISAATPVPDWTEPDLVAEGGRDTLTHQHCPVCTLHTATR